MTKVEKPWLAVFLIKQCRDFIRKRDRKSSTVTHLKEIELEIAMRK